MKNGKNPGSRIVILALSICLIVYSFWTQTLPVSAQTEGLTFDTYVKETAFPALYIGNFSVENDTLYLGAETVQRLEKKDTAAVDGNSLPFVETLRKMGYTASFKEEERMLYIRETPDYTQLQDLMEEIYEQTAYNMYYWQNSGTYDADVEVALAADCIKNFAYTSYMSGHESETQYKDAFWSILLPEENANLDVLSNMEETGKMVKQTYEIGENVVELVGKVAGAKGIEGLEGYKKFNVHKEGDLLDITTKSFGDITGYFQLDDIKELLIFTDVMNSTNTAAVRGLDLVLRKHKNVEKVIKKAGNDVLDVYRGEESVDEKFFLTMVNENLLDAVTDKANEFVFGPEKVFADIVNLALDEHLGTQTQVNAVIGAARCLEIQKLCGDYYKTLEKKLKKADWDEKDAIMRDMHDVTVVYLLAGAEAQRAIAIDKDLKATAGWTLKCIDADLTLLAEYHEEQFGALEELRETEKQLIAYAESLAVTPDKLPLAPLAQQGTLTITWSGEGANGWDTWAGGALMEANELNVMLEGGFEDGSILSYTSEGTCFTTDGKLVAQILKSEQQIVIEFYDMNAYYTVTIENSFPDNSWLETTQITYDASGITNFDANSYLNRGMTGFWYYRITLDHGIPVQAY